MGILPCFLMVFLWADISTFVNMDNDTYEAKRADLVKADVANSIYDKEMMRSNQPNFDAYLDHVIIQALAKMTKNQSTFIPYRRYDAAMEEELKKLDLYQLVHEMPKPALLNAQFPLNMAPEEILTAIKHATGNTNLHEGKKQGHPTQLFVEGDPNLANMEQQSPINKDNITHHLSFDEDFLADPNPKKYWGKVHNMLKYLEHLLKIEEVISHMVKVNIDSLQHESVEYVEFRAFFPEKIYKLHDTNTPTGENFPQVVERAVREHNNGLFEVKLIFLIDRDLKGKHLHAAYERFVNAYENPTGMVVGFDVVSICLSCANS